MSAGVAIDGNGNIYMVGAFNEGIDLGGGSLGIDESGVFLAKFDPDGIHQWSKAIGKKPAGAPWAFPVSISTNAQGDVLVTLELYDTETLTRFDAQGNEIWNVRVGPGAVAVGPDGSVAFVGYFDWYHPLKLVYLSSNGSIAWSHELPTGVSGWGPMLPELHVGIGPFGSVSVVGDLPQSSTANPTVNNQTCISNYDALGKPSWSRCISYTGHSSSNEVAFDSLGNTFIAGYSTTKLDFCATTSTSTTIAGTKALHIAEFSPSGNCMWSFNGESPYAGTQLTVTPAGQAVLTTGINSWFQISDSAPVSTTGAYVFDFNPDGHVTGSTQLSKWSFPAIDVVANANDYIIVAGALEGTLSLPALPSVTDTNGIFVGKIRLGK